MIRTFAIAVLAGLAAQRSVNTAEPADALVGAHAHNDYNHERPLFDALERGFASIEADVFLVDGQLLVGHFEHELRAKRTLDALYLAPLREHLQANAGRVFRGDERLTLLVDFKTDGAAAYSALATLLEKYDGVFYDMQYGKLIPRAVDVVISGNRPINAITRDPKRRVAIDGRLADLAGDAPKDLMPLVSESWNDHFAWQGVGPMPVAQRKRLRKIVEQVHEKNRILRFWATLDNSAVWKELEAAGVDVIAADDLDALQQFLCKPTSTD